MKPLPRKLLLALCALLALAALAPVASAAGGPAARTGSLLYVQQVGGGELVRLGPGQFELRLTAVSPRVSTFTDRPRRRAGSERLASFVGGWSEQGFAADPPNAALVLDRGPRSRDVALLTLSHPRYDRRRGTLGYRVTPLHQEDAGALDSFSRRADRVRAGDFGAASLFIDDGGGALTNITIDVEGATSGQTLTLEASAPGGRAAWTLEGPGRGAFSLFAMSPGMQLTSLVAYEGSLSFGTSFEGGTYSFQANLGLEVEGSEAVSLAAKGQAGATVTATYPTAVGPDTQVLTEGPTQIRPAY